MPLFVLFAGESIVTHGFVFTTLQAQPTKVVTEREPVSAAAVCAALLAESVNAQPAPACVMVKFCPAMLTTPLRASAVGFASTP